MNCHFLVTLTSFTVFFFSSERKTLHDCDRSETEIGFGFVCTLLYCTADVSDLNLYNAFVKAGLHLRILPYHGSLTSELGISLNSRFSFGRNGGHLDRPSASMSLINCLLLLV